MNHSLETARRIASAAAELGGRAYYVGGFVRDRLLRHPSKDVDIEVHGITPPQLEAILDSMGQRLEMGKSFGVYGLKGCDLDIAMPRRETATGRGHRDFQVDVDPFIGTKKAASRRDFTVNAILEDVLTGEIIDHFGGVQDMEKGILRHVCDESFPEDALRVLRAAQFAARLKFTVAPQTVELCKGLPLDALPRERIMEELRKALLKAEKPSVFFDTLRRMEQLSFWFPEVAALIGVPQNPMYHAEGDVWNHTMMVLDQAAARRTRANQPLYLMLSALCHDFGKPQTTKLIDGRIRSFGHEAAGVPVAEAFLTRLTGEMHLIKYVLSMVQLHMRPGDLFRQRSSVKATNRLFDLAIDPEDLILLFLSDSTGKLPLCGDVEQSETFLRNRLAHYRSIMALPAVTGQDLIAAGLRPGKHFAALLQHAHKLHLSGMEREQALKQTLAFAKQMEE